MSLRIKEKGDGVPGNEAIMPMHCRVRTGSFVAIWKLGGRCFST